MTSDPSSDAGLEQQRASIEASFRRGWRAVGDGVLTERWYAEARRILDHGGWTGLAPAIVDAVRQGAQPGDELPLPQPRPYIDHISDIEVMITGGGEDPCVAVLFSYRFCPGIRFGHRFPHDDGGLELEKVWLKEAIETGALDRMMADPPAPDGAGVVWTNWADES